MNLVRRSAFFVLQGFAVTVAAMGLYTIAVADVVSAIPYFVIAGLCVLAGFGARAI